MDAKEKTEIQRERQLRLTNDELEGKLLRVIDVEAKWTDWMAEFRSLIEAFPAQMAAKGKFNATEMAVIRKGLDEMVGSLGKFSKRKDAAAAAAARRTDKKPADEAKPKRIRQRKPGSRRSRQESAK